MPFYQAPDERILQQTEILRARSSTGLLQKAERKDLLASESGLDLRTTHAANENGNAEGEAGDDAGGDEVVPIERDAGYVASEKSAEGMRIHVCSDCPY